MSPQKAIYMIAFGDFEFFKVGVSNDVKGRLKTLQAACPRELRIVVEIPCASHHAFMIESIFHRHMKPFRTFGEWYAAPLEQLVEELNNVIDVYYQSANRRRVEAKVQKMQRRIHPHNQVAEILLRPLP